MNMHYHELKVAKAAMNKTINAILEADDPKNRIRACIGIRVLGKLRPLHFLDLLQRLSCLLPCEDVIASEFITCTIAKFCRSSYLKDQNFLVFELERCKDWLSGTINECKVNNALNLLGWFAMFASTTLLISSQQFLDALTVGIFHKNLQVRIRSEKKICDFLDRSKKGPKILTLFQTARRLLTSEHPEEQHGSLIVLYAYGNMYPELLAKDASSYMSKCRQLMKSEEEYVSIAALRLLIVLAPLDPLTFRNEHTEAVTSILWRDSHPPNSVVKCNIMLLKNLPDVFENNDHKLLTMIRSLFALRNEESEKVSFALLQAFNVNLPVIYQTRLVEVAGIIVLAPFTNNFLEIVPQLLHETQALWTLTEKNLLKKLVSEINEGRCEIPLRIIAKCPKFSPQNSEILLPLIRPLLNSTDQNIRQYTPAALLSLSSDIYADSYRELVDDILSLAVSETSVEVRLAIMESLTPPYSPFLSFPSALSLFSVLVNDDSFRVRSRTLTILGELAESNPSMILSIFRRVMLDALFICESSPLLKLQAQTTRCFPIIIKACKPILPIYIPAFIPIAMTYLRKNICHQNQDQSLKNLTTFEQDFSRLISINFIDTISLSCQMQTSLLSPQFKEIANLFIDILTESVHKSIAISALDALCFIIDYMGVNARKEFPTLLNTLFSIGSRYSSTKVHAAIFKVYGRFGAALPQIEEKEISLTENFDRNYEQDFINGQITLEEWSIVNVSSALLWLLDDDQQYAIHLRTLQALTDIFKDNSTISKPFFTQFILNLIQQLRGAVTDEKEQYFTILRENIIKHPDWMKHYAGDLEKLVYELRGTPFFHLILDLIPTITKYLAESFSPFLPEIVTSLLDTLFEFELQQPEIACNILNCLTELSMFADDFVFIILRQIYEVVNNPASFDEVVLTAVNSLHKLSLLYDCSAYSSLLVRACFQCFRNNNEEIRLAAVKLLKSLSKTLGKEFEIYKGHAIIQLNASKLMTDEIKEAFEKDLSLEDLKLQNEQENDEIELEKSDKTENDNSVDNYQIITSVQCEQTFTSSQWKDWIRGLSLCVIAQAPSPIIKRCYSLAQSCTGFALKLLHAAFLMCWDVISTSTRYVICKALNAALMDNETPMYVLTIVVSLAEFMEKAEKHLNISYQDLARAAHRAEKLPFALFCAQKDLDNNSMSQQTIEMLLRIYNQLALEDDVHGLIHTLRESKKIKFTPKFAAQLGDWQKAIDLYKNDIESNDSFLGLLNSYSMVSDWDSITSLFSRFDILPALDKSNAAQIFALAFYHQNDWEHFNMATKFCPNDSIPSIITKCYANIKLGLPINDLVEQGFNSLGHKAGSLFPHGFSSFIPFLIQAEMLVELQEKPKAEIWAQRVRNPYLSFMQLQPLILMRIELLGDKISAQNEILTLLKLARNASEWNLHDYYFNIYYPDFDILKSPTPVVFEHSVSLWKRQEKTEALDVLNKLIERLEKEKCDKQLTERCLFMKARWIVRSDTLENNADTFRSVAKICKRGGKSHKALQLWGWIQLRLYNMKDSDRENAAINAITTFIKCAEGISEMMQLCSIVFRAGKFPNVFNTVKKNLETIKTELWLPMIPQLFAQFMNPIKYLQEFAQETIWHCLLEHHHAVIFSLMFCISFNDSNDQRGKQMLNEFSKIRNDVVEASSIIYLGLMTACTNRAEMWLENLNLAVDHFKAGKLQEMKTTLEKIFASTKSINSDADLYFVRLFGDRINNLQQSFKRFFVTKNKKDVEQSWSDYRSLCNDIKNEIEQMSSIPMRFVAPRLSELNDIPIAVPGTYKPGSEVITMKKFASSLDVFPSKQRPKRLAIIGSNGGEFWYLLKGHEDLRLDQRVVQVFHLINTFIPIEMPKIVTNFIMPLLPTVGLIQWIPGSDTMFKLIRDFRSARNIPVDYESRLLSQITTPKFDDLRPIQRLEALQQVSNETSDSVLSDILWLKAPDAENWIKRVTTFSRTSALMSVVGYILGLGDRHPSNIMIHNFTGSVIHVDFGDCFETTKERVLFPELIPFRLTRFMIRAFGPAGIDGSFRKTCLDIVKLIRRHREEVLSVLEIFAHAPLVRSFGTTGIKPNRNSQFSASLPSNAGSDENDIDRAINRISDKINGRDFDLKHRLTQQEQVTKLICSATDMYNFAHLYHGWNPLW
ncbi:PIKK family atypical protein kinase [Trichomonas vaginalis G3]|uniref:non-specific serine/threonine protein kinase n=1 Tax=Trichomonas vaginalis (strain ATCC PRA-98 / G3) TaxID=412133 RepID=A2EZL1_TRIV3|nr:ataxia telangiectasia mutated (ATM) -related family [Trichomonas vaginalis G3]EAY01919.1 PIKK family atypical protein kinase [Trichomonas vaginalis G3]KAI5485290.1 ataxia telangiectasia mutated (ATM) -related family [Trichomonas vaginalis G3]|eukprot:XP_001314458.1 PIKK family atypical protein kinase [Trichomonas vaginalis G3]